MSSFIAKKLDVLKLGLCFHYRNKCLDFQYLHPALRYGLFHKVPMRSCRILSRHGPQPDRIQTSVLQGFDEPGPEVLKRESGRVQGFKQIHGKPFGWRLFRETDSAEPDRLVQPCG
jgi:hypothetical protein